MDQFYGIEIEEFPREIAQVAMWLTDQMNMQVSVEFGQPFIRLPLKHAATIRHGNALRLDWNDVISAEKVDYILGNPPFVGKQYQSEEQKKDLEQTFAAIRGAGVLDYVAAWYIKAVRYVRGEESTQTLLEGFGEGPRERVKTAFVSTNSITQGEQVSVLWSELLRLGVKIHFAHRTFRWSNEGRGMAAVHCVIVGFALFDTASKTIYEYSDIRGEPQGMQALNINPYLVNAPDVLVIKRRVPISSVAEIAFGNMPNDGGNLLLSGEERDALVNTCPNATAWLRPLRGSDEFIHNRERWCLWLEGITPTELRSMPEVMQRVEQVKRHRLSSAREITRALALTPTLFGEYDSLGTTTSSFQRSRRKTGRIFQLDSCNGQLYPPISYTLFQVQACTTSEYWPPRFTWLGLRA